MEAISFEEVCNNLGEAMDKVVNNHSPLIGLFGDRQAMQHRS